MASSGEVMPSLKENILISYRPWYTVVALLSVFTGAALLAMGITMKSLDNEISWLVCHIWTGIPLIAGGFISLLPCGTRSKSAAIFHLIFMLACMVTCAAGGIVNGLEYWFKYWGPAKLALDNDKCAVEFGYCACTTLTGRLKIWLPVSTKTCVDLKYIVRLMISTIAIDVLGFIVSLMAACLSLMSACCGPWSYVLPLKDPVVYTGIVNKGLSNRID